MENKFTSINELGEFGLIDHLTKDIKIKNPGTIKGIGDDCCVIDNANLQTLVSVDLFIENIHFDLTYTPLNHLGYKAVISGISDLSAMNAEADQILVSIAISSKYSLEMIEEIYKGMIAACEKYAVDFCGGDTTTIPNGLVINITSIGKARKKDIVYRNGAKPNDLLCVTGDLGGSYTGLLILEREKQVFIANNEMQPELNDYKYILKRHLMPEARKDIVALFRELQIKPTAMIDISDGLSSEIIHICSQSGVGCKLFEEKIPIDELTYLTARELNLDPTTCALNGGEDYELLFTVRPEVYEKIKDHPDISIIGHITDTEKDYRLMTKGGNEFPLKAQGWKAFNKE